ncbi:MAG: (2Fe-2S) ferredoxin domain-containing protein [Clostridiales bacterium]|nr:(2Fe-2S) ferredoxin domain-containing protein [Clostridiales bacterium]
MGTPGITNGAREVMAAFVEAVHDQHLYDNVVVYPADLGEAGKAPVVVVDIPGEAKVTYVDMSPEKALKVVNQHIVGKKAVAEYTK